MFAYNFITKVGHLSTNDVVTLTGVNYFNGTTTCLTCAYMSRTHIEESKLKRKACFLLLYSNL